MATSSPNIHAGLLSASAHDPSSRERARKLLERSKTKLYGWVAAVACVSVLVTTLATPPNANFWRLATNCASLLAIIATGLGVVCLLLSVKLDDRSDSMDKRLQSLLKHFGVKELRGTTKELEDRAPDDVKPAWDAPVTTVGKPGERFDFFALEDVPMRVIADLINHWREAQKTGKRLLGQIQCVFRAHGDENHPWLVEFQNEEVWRIAYAGDSEHATVKRLSVEAFP